MTKPACPKCGLKKNVEWMRHVPMAQSDIYQDHLYRCNSCDLKFEYGMGYSQPVDPETGEQFDFEE